MLNWQLSIRIAHQTGIKLGALANVCSSISVLRNWGGNCVCCLYDMDVTIPISFHDGLLHTGFSSSSSTVFD